MAYDFNLAPKALDEQCAAFKKKHPTLDDLLVADYIMMPKYDGCLGIVVSSEDRIITRTGEVVRSMPHVLETARRMLPGWVIFGEAWNFDTPFKDISGAFRRHAPQDHLFLVAYDAVPYADWKAGVCNIPYERRLAALRAAWDPTLGPGIIVASATDAAGSQGFANALVAQGGYDGAILRKKEAGWHTGASKNGEAIKVKPVKSLDLRIVDWFPGKGKHLGRAGGITVIHNGVKTDVGTGFTDAERELIVKCPANAGIAEIEFMEVTSDGKLREPRFKGWRFDKTEADA